MEQLVGVRRVQDRVPTDRASKALTAATRQHCRSVLASGETDEGVAATADSAAP